MTVTRRHLLKLASGATAAVSASRFAAAAVPARRSSRPPYGRLRQLLDGRLFLPRDPGFPTAQHAHTREFDGVPSQAIVLAGSTADVRRAVLFAQDHALALSVRSGGHHLHGWSTGPGLVLDLSRLNRRTTVAEDGSVRLGPGTTAVDTLEALAPRQLVVPSGLCATVCPGGFVLGGGIGLLTPYSGVACDRLLSAEVVLADGRVVTASADSHPDLLWALRGGGGGEFGVVTQLSMRPQRLSGVTSYMMAWPFDAADRVGSAWQHWQADRPHALGGALILIRADELPLSVPFVLATGLWAGEPERLSPHLDELIDTAAVPPLLRMETPLSYREAMLNTWALDTTLPARPVTKDLLCPAAVLSDVAKSLLPRPALRVVQGRYFDHPMPGDGIDRWLGAFAAERRPGQSRISMALRVGGRAAQEARDSTAYVHRTAGYHLDFAAQQHVSGDITADAAAARAWAARGIARITEYSNGEAYVNFPEPELADFERAYWVENVPRLREVKRHYDPHAVFRQRQSLQG